MSKKVRGAVDVGLRTLPQTNLPMASPVHLSYDNLIAAPRDQEHPEEELRPTLFFPRVWPTEGAQ